MTMAMSSRGSTRMVVLACLLAAGASCRDEGTDGTTDLTTTTHAADTTAATAEPDAAAVVWAPCDDEELAAGECATVTVPLDYGDPDGPTIDIALFRLRARGPRVATLVLNPGARAPRASTT